MFVIRFKTLNRQIIYFKLMSHNVVIQVIMQFLFHNLG